MDRKPRVLGVDDSLTIRKALEIVLKPAGYELELAVDGADALAKAKSFKPDVILLDFILPDMRGSEVCQHLALDPETAHIPVILVSAKGAEIRQAYRDARNVVSYIAKPFKPQVVTGIVAEVLAKAAAGEQVKAAVPVHEAEGLSIPPVMPVQAPPPPPTPAAVPPMVSSPALSAPEKELPLGGAVATTPTPVPSAPPPPAPRPRKVARREAPLLPLGEGPRAEFGTPFTSEASRREALDLMFETLRSSTEGVYVEEVDTPLGATADQAKSYTDILEALIRELGEGLHHAQSGAKYRLYSDGSVRSFDESLHEIFRRACRLLLRATSAGAIAHETPAQKQRVLVIATKGGTVHRQLPALAAAHPEWQLFSVTEGFRQVPMVMRLFAPAVVLTELTWSGALWEQLGLAGRLPEMAAAQVIGIASRDRTPPPALVEEGNRQAALRERGIRSVVESLFDAERLILGNLPSAETLAPTEAGNGQAEPAAADAAAATPASGEAPPESPPVV